MHENSQQFVVTDTLKVQMFAMPVIDLRLRYCYRFVEPIQMIWQTDFQITSALLIPLGVFDEIVKHTMLGKYKMIIANSRNLVGEAEWEKIKWLENVNKVELIDCDLVPKGAK